MNKETISKLHEIREFLNRLIDTTIMDEVHDLLVNHGEDQVEQFDKCLTDIGPADDNTYTIVGSFNDGEIYIGYFEAENPYQAMAKAAKESPDVNVTVAIKGKHVEYGTIELPGSAVVDGRTILEQSDVFC